MMKKRLIMVGAAAIAAAGILAGCGGNNGSGTEKVSGDVTAQSLAKAASEGMQKIKSYSFTGDTKMNYAMKSGESDMSMDVDMSMEGEGILESNEAHVVVDMDMAWLGQEISSLSEAYAVMEDGKYTVYTKSESNGENTGWQKSEEETKVEFDKLINIDVYKQIADGKIEAELSEGEKINGKDVYKLTCKIPGEIFQQTFSAMGQDDNSGIAGIDFSGAAADCELYIYKDSGLPARTFMDAKEYTESIFEQAMTQSGTSQNVEISVDSFEVDMILDDYDKIDKIDIPAEVLNAV